MQLLLVLAAFGAVVCRGASLSEGRLGGGSAGFLAEVHEATVLDSAWRPDVVAIKSNLYLAYNGGSSFRDGAFRLLVLDQDLKAVSDKPLAYRKGGVSDIRVRTDNSGSFWYVYESVGGRAPGCDNKVNGAFYGPDLKLLAHKKDLSSGCATGPKRLEIPAEQIGPDPQAADDPAPFFRDGRYYVLNRAWSGSVQHIRVYDAGFNELEYFTLDLAGKFGAGAVLSQNSLLDMDGTVHLIGGVSDGPPVRKGTRSDIYAIPLSGDMKRVAGKPVRLTAAEGFKTRVTSSFFTKGTLFIAYQDLHGRAQYLEAFNVHAGFKSYGRVKFQNTIVGDGHASFAVLGGRLYLFYNSARRNVSVKVFDVSAPGPVAAVRERRGNAGERADCDFNQDGSVDAVEQRRCGDARGRPSREPRTSPGGKCGDGVCDGVERRTGFCPRDCG